MNENRIKFLLDTSIQVKRLISQKWFEAGLDRTWNSIVPVTCIYSLMEFKNSVICALGYLIDVLQEIKARKEMDDAVGVRLSEVITYLNMDSTIRETDRRVRLASAYAAKVLEENQYYARPRAISQVIEQLRIEAENLEEVWFFHYAEGDQPKRMEIIDRVGCFIGRNKSPLDRGESRYSCLKGEVPCNIIEYLNNSNMLKVTQAICEKIIKIRNARLKEGAEAIHQEINNGNLDHGYSIGQRLCHPIGDCILATKAEMEGLGILTGDRDQISLANYLGMRALFYNSKYAAIIEEKEE